ncbi:MAG: lipoyl(octanoyl) transferase [Solirubrobacteraceae bacterium]|jgi:lipoyl(octanoyl) transferase|nr:lipoyl(octanoyl) transferase [Solirubrobacteraceae bacterium]
MDELWTCWLGTVGYDEAHALQERIRAARQADRVPDVLLLLEHPPVYTRTRRTAASDLPRGEAWYAAQGIAIVETDRGGKLTYHGPGQLVGYPIMRAGHVLPFVRTMERAIVAALADSGVQAHARADESAAFVGAWVEDRKIASIGIRVKGGVTKHGLAINVINDLAPFGWAVACGLPGVTMTSVEREAGELRSDPMGCLRKDLAHRFAEELGLRQRLVSPARLRAAVDDPSIAA